jgi:hypothetical protein
MLAGTGGCPPYLQGRRDTHGRDALRLHTYTYIESVRLRERRLEIVLYVISSVTWQDDRPPMAPVGLPDVNVREGRNRDPCRSTCTLRCRVMAVGLAAQLVVVVLGVAEGVEAGGEDDGAGAKELPPQLAPFVRLSHPYAHNRGVQPPPITEPVSRAIGSKSPARTQTTPRDPFRGHRIPAEHRQPKAPAGLGKRLSLAET